MQQSTLFPKHNVAKNRTDQNTKMQRREAIGLVVVVVCSLELFPDHSVRQEHLSVALLSERVTRAREIVFKIAGDVVFVRRILVRRVGLIRFGCRVKENRTIIGNLRCTARL